MDDLGYTGHDMDADTGLTYMQQRYYDPVIGRFLSNDPVDMDAGSGGNFNRYWYANNNPYRFVDPDGRHPAAAAGAVARKAVVELVIEASFQYVTEGRVDLKEAATNVAKDSFDPTKKLKRYFRGIKHLYSKRKGQGLDKVADAGSGATDPAIKRLGPDAPLQRYQGPWTERDLARGANGQGPLDMVPTRDAAGREVPLQLHHPGQLPGRGVHEVSPAEHRTPGLHPLPNQGVTDEIRRQDRETHWRQRASEQGGG